MNAIITWLNMVRIKSVHVVQDEWSNSVAAKTKVYPSNRKRCRSD